MLRSNFKYNGRSLADFGMKMYDPDADPQGVERTIDKAAQNSAREVPNHYATYRNGVLQHNMLIIKDPDLHESSNDLRLTEKEVHRIKSWLFSTTLPTELILPQDDEEIDVRYFGVFTNVQYYMPVRKTCFGLQLTFTCNAPYGFSPITSKRFWITAPEVEGDFVNNIVEFAAMTAPQIVIKADGNSTFHGETLTLTNVSDGEKQMNIVLPNNYYKIVIDERTKIITGYRDNNGTEVIDTLTLSDIGLELYPAIQDSTHGFQLINTYSLYWLALVPGSNVLRFETEQPDGQTFSNYSVEVRTRYIIEAGGF